MIKKKVILLILDGLGEGQENISNPFRFAKVKNFPYFKKNYPFLLLSASGISVGLPPKEPGNCEVGHLTMGTGIVYYQNYPKITLTIERGEFFQNKKLLKIFEHCRKFNSRLHLAGLLSESINKAALEHLLALLELAKRQNFENLYLHLFTDGLDSSPKSALNLLKRLKEKIDKEKYPGKIATLCGRFYTLDESRNYLLRTQRAFLLLVKGLGTFITNIEEFLKEKYQDPSFNDSLLEPIILEKDGFLKDNDALLFFNHEGKSIFQLANAFLNPDFQEFPRPEKKNLYLASLTRYLENIDYPIIFETTKISTNLTRILAENNLWQMKMVDISRENLFKYYFNGFFVEEHPQEVYKIFPPFENDKLLTQAKEMIDALILIIKEGNFDFILLNLPVFDIIGHSGNFQLAIKIIEEVDELLRDLYQELTKTKNYLLIITSDHGNIEKMIEPVISQKDTEHNLSPVPFYFIDPERKKEKTKEELSFYHKKILGSLVDIAPTILEIFNLKPPPEFEGKSLLRYFENA